jgi:hypothetical protein
VTVREWLSSRVPAPPAALAIRLTDALQNHLDDDAGAMYDCAIDTAATLLAEVIARPTSGRECALDLLTADALTTYAFEAAATDPATLERRSENAMHRLAEIGARGAA